MSRQYSVQDDPPTKGLESFQLTNTTKPDYTPSEMQPDAEELRPPHFVTIEEAEETEFFDYRAYRHRLMEGVLMKYYAERQPPGQVVMNSIHLNALDDTKVLVWF